MKEKQWETVLNMLRTRPVSTLDIMAKYILAPQKVIETLRKKGYDIETKPVEGEKFCLYVLNEHTEQLGLFNEAT